MEPPYKSRRNFLAKTAEWVSTVPLLWLIAENFRNRTSYYEIDDQNARILESSHPTINEIAKLNTLLGDSLDALDSNYRRAYHKSYVRMEPHINMSGKTPVVTMSPVTYYTWEEPSSVPQHTVIEGWKGFHKSFSGKIDEIAGEAMVDLERLDELAVSKQTTGTGREGLLSIAIYAPQIAGLLFYEEAIARLRHQDEFNYSAEQLVDRHDTPSQITRRSFFKIGAALAGACVAYPIVDYNKGKREEAKDSLGEEIDRVRSFKKNSGNEVFTEYFGMEATDLIERYRDQVILSKQTLMEDVRDDGVRSALSDFVETGSQYVNSMGNLIGPGTPHDMEDAIKSAMISKSLKDKSVYEHKAVYASLGLTGLAVAGAIAATLLPLELVNEYFANKSEKDASGFK